jgi:CcmD family protein
MEGPADTYSYMIAGYVVIFGVIFAYLASLVVRRRSLMREKSMLEQIEEEESQTGV